MKLALIRRQFAATGGAELYTQRLLAALAGAGHEVHLFAESWSGAPQNVRLVTVPVKGGRSERPLCFAENVKTALAQERYDCVFSLERTLQQDVYRAGDGVHRVWLERRKQFASGWKKWLVGRGAFHRNMMALEARTFDPENTGRIIVNSDMVKREILQHFNFPADKIHLVRNGIEIGRFQRADRAAARAQFGFGPDDYVLLFVGSGWERKGLKYLLQAAKLLQGSEFAEAIAEGVKKAAEKIPLFHPKDQHQTPHTPPHSAHLKVLVVGKGKVPSSLPRDTIFAGPLERISPAYAAADLFVFLPTYEPSANVVFEALAAGLPVVTTSQNGASELIEEDINGTVLDDPAAIDGVAQAIAYWWSRRFYTPPIHTKDLSIERNVSETMAVLELAAKERAR